MYDIYDLIDGCSTIDSFCKTKKEANNKLKQLKEFDRLNGIESNLIIVKVIKKDNKYYTQF